ncbi:MAG TPA: hypothetical protein VMK12_23080 [Anaeromyxobacteraceae bacterium]|nr:hypothetical protein [Anaeromyxobacteraceae bacterium]
MKKVPTNLGASVRQRLLNLAKAHNEDFNLILMRFASCTARPSWRTRTAGFWRPDPGRSGERFRLTSGPRRADLSRHARRDTEEAGPGRLLLGRVGSRTHS